MLSIEIIEEHAVDLLREHDVNEAPVDVFDIIRERSIGLSFEEMEDDHSGLLLVENGTAQIAINRSHHCHRQRFSAAHELGHYVLHTEGRDRLFVDTSYRRSAASSTGTDVIEIEANRFAAALLMPRFIVTRFAGDMPLTDIDINHLAMKFLVSEQAMTLRLVRLGLADPQ